MERPTLRQLEILAEIAVAGSFRGAARNLGLSQVAVSDHVRQLEARLGGALFIRTVGGKPSLSPAGQVVLEHGRNVLFACDALIAAARKVASEGREGPCTDMVMGQPASFALVEAEEDGAASSVTSAPGQAVKPVRLLAAGREAVREPIMNREAAPVPDDDRDGMGSDKADADDQAITIASHPAILSRFQDKLAAAQDAFPERPIAVDFARFTPRVLSDAVARGTVDIALFYALGPTSDLPSDYLWSERWSLFARADHPLAQMAAVHFADCVDMPVIMFDAANPLRTLCEGALAAAGLWPTPTVLETDDFGAIADELDYGEAIFPAFGVTAAQFAARPGIRRIALMDSIPPVEVRRALSPAASIDPTVMALAGLLG